MINDKYQTGIFKTLKSLIPINREGKAIW